LTSGYVWPIGVLTLRWSPVGNLWNFWAIITSDRLIVLRACSVNLKSSFACYTLIILFGISPWISLWRSLGNLTSTTNSLSTSHSPLCTDLARATTALWFLLPELVINVSLNLFVIFSSSHLLFNLPNLLR